MKSIIIASIASLSPVLQSSQVPAEEPTAEHVRVLQALCDTDLQVRSMTIAVAKPGIYTFAWDNKDTCTHDNSDQK